ncbi:MAG TPA: aspartate/glutamate racemase family protein [Steroidobacteraceae bacterium]|nr:aspartate/glutamate racemase family protein [Steroidobacteraceae bacterium]
MRIAVLSSGSSATDLPQQLAELATPEVTPVLVDPRLSVFAKTPYERLVADLGFVDAAQMAERAGFDAVFINSFADYGIAAARAALAVPVVGAGEATLRAAAEGGRRFAIVTVWPESMAHLYEERLRTLGLESQCVAIHYFSPEEELARVGHREGVMDRMGRGDDALLRGLLATCERAVRMDAAECIVLGCTCMAPVGPALSKACSVPVLESACVGYRAAVEAARAHGASRRDGTAPGRKLVPQIVEAWLGASAHADGEPGTGDSAACPVCITFEGDAYPATPGPARADR